MLWRTGKQEEAGRTYEQALKLDPGDVPTQYKLGCLWVGLSDADAAKPLLEGVLGEVASLKMTRYYLGRPRRSWVTTMPRLQTFAGRLKRIRTMRRPSRRGLAFAGVQATA